MKFGLTNINKSFITILMRVVFSYIYYINKSMFVVNGLSCKMQKLISTENKVLFWCYLLIVRYNMTDFSIFVNKLLSEQVISIAAKLLKH